MTDEQFPASQPSSIESPPPRTVDFQPETGTFALSPETQAPARGNDPAAPVIPPGTAQINQDYGVGSSGGGAAFLAALRNQGSVRRSPGFQPNGAGRDFTGQLGREAVVTAPPAPGPGEEGDTPTLPKASAPLVTAPVQAGETPAEPTGEDAKPDPQQKLLREQAEAERAKFLAGKVSGAVLENLADIRNYRNVVDFTLKDGSHILDNGERLKLRSKQVTDQGVQSIVGLAAAHEWKSVEITGSKEFKARTWLAMQAAGIEVTNYDPPPGVKALWEIQKAKMEAEERAKAALGPEGAQPGASADGPSPAGGPTGGDVSPGNTVQPSNIVQPAGTAGGQPLAPAASAASTAQPVSAEAKARELSADQGRSGSLMQVAEAEIRMQEQMQAFQQMAGAGSPTAGRQLWELQNNFKVLNRVGELLTEGRNDDLMLNAQAAAVGGEYDKARKILDRIDPPKGHEAHADPLSVKPQGAQSPSAVTLSTATQSLVDAAAGAAPIQVSPKVVEQQFTAPTPVRTGGLKR